jgi:hypothetical protein
MNDLWFLGLVGLVFVVFFAGILAIKGYAAQDSPPPHSSWLEPWVLQDKANDNGIYTDALDLAWEIEDKAGGGGTTVRGVAKEGNKVNKNGYYYATGELEKMVSRAQDAIKDGGLVGVASDTDHWGGVPNVAIKFSRLWMDGNLVRFEGDIIDTTSGQNVRTVLKSGVKVGMSTVVAAAKYSYAEAKSVDSSYPYPNQEVLILEDLTLRRIDPVLNPADEKGNVKADNQNQPPKEQPMTLEDLKKNHPELYAKAVEDAKKGLETATDTKKLEDELVALRAKDAARDKADLERTRKGLVKAALDEAKLPKLGKTEGNVDLDARFVVRLEDAAVAAKDDKAAAEAIAEAIAERKAMLGVRPTKTGREIPAGDSEAMLRKAGEEQAALSDSSKATIANLRRF